MEVENEEKVKNKKVVMVDLEIVEEESEVHKSTKELMMYENFMKFYRIPYIDGQSMAPNVLPREALWVTFGASMMMVFKKRSNRFVHLFCDMLLSLLKEIWVRNIIPDETPLNVHKRKRGGMHGHPRILHMEGNHRFIRALPDHHPQLPARRVASDTSPNCPKEKLSNCHDNTNLHWRRMKKDSQPWKRIARLRADKATETGS
ncbi:unnamed protein product [Dovyalis caffra]|uniref:Uncharacterized protein n=1 Tax=Dovyalis caffra TaxID=77055 RepID=A0AAV1SSC3_9ROSI|nr:unnamed protein product [Dovyalis caffra]